MPPPPPRLPPPPAPFGIKPAGNDGRNNVNGTSFPVKQSSMMTQQVGGRAVPMMPNAANSNTGGGNIHPPRAPPPPMMMMMNRNVNNHHHQQQQGPSPPAAFSQQQQHFNNRNNYSAPTSQFNNLDISNPATSSMTSSSAYSSSGVHQQELQQYGGGVAATSNNNNNMPPPPPPMMATQHNRQQRPLPPPPPPMQHQQQQHSQFSNNAMPMQPPLQPPAPSAYHSQQQLQPAQQMQSSSSLRPPPQPQRPQYNNNNNNYPQPTAPSTINSSYNSSNNNNSKIDPSQIPRIPLFTRPHHAPATIYPNQTNYHNNNTINGGINHSGSSRGPPPLDSRYIFNSSLKNNAPGRGGGIRSCCNASPRLLASTVHTFPMDHKTLRSCGDLPLGLIVTPLGCLTSLCCRGDDDALNDALNDGVAVANTTTTTTTSTQWNGREQGDIYSENRTDTLSCKDVDYVISPFDGNGIINMGGNSGGGGGTNGRKEPEDDDPERIPVIRGTKRSIKVSDDTATTNNNAHHASTRMKTTQTITPPRCNRCNAYLNPYCTPSSSSSTSTSSTLTNTFQGLIYTPTQSYNCNMCGSKSSIVISNEEYIANNIFESTSLSCGTVEYEVGGEYCVRKSGAVENVFLYGVEYVPEGIDGYVNQQQHHHHHGTMKSHGWREALDAIRNVARELCLTAPRREQDGVVVKEAKIGIFAFCQDMLVFPYIKRKGHNGSNEEDDEEELAVAIVSDVTEDPFCPLPLNSWSYNVGDGLESKEWYRFCRILDSFTELMEQLSGESSPQQQQQNDKWKRNCGGAALVALSDALRDSGGRGTLITTRRPNYGVGALRDREAVTKYGIGSSSEQKLFTPLQHLVQRNNDAVGMIKDKPAGLFYKKLGEECAKNRVCLDIVVTSSSVSIPSTDPKQLNKNPNMREFLDVATLGELCRVTCGNFKWLRVGNECGVAVNGINSDSFTGEQLREELKRSALAYTGSDVVFKLRCSNGVQVKSYSPTLPVGKLVGDGIVNSAELELSSMYPGTSIAVVLEHKIGGVVDTMNGSSSRKGIDMPMVFFQSAVLYTTKTGQRRVRVSTLGLPTTKVPADIFRSADLGAVSTIFTRGAISDVERDGGSLRLARDNVFNKCVSILANYRSHTTARTSSSGQLILPESLQLLPLFCLSLRKSRMLRHSLPKGVTSAKPFPTADERAYHIFYGRMVSPNMSLQCVHPHLFQVSDMRTRDGDWITPPVLQENKFDEANVIAASMRPVCQLPKTMNPSIACLDESGMYILDDRFSFYLFIGRDVPDEKWQDLLSVGGVGSSRIRGSSIPTGGLSLANTESAHKLRSVIHQLRMLNSPNETLGLTARNTYAPLILVFVGRGSVFEEEMDSLLVDDPDSHERSYVDFLCDIHRSVREKLDQ